MRDNLNGPFNHYTIVSVGDNPQGIKAIWEDLASRDPEIKKLYQGFLDNVKKVNKLSQEQFKESPSFFRGTSTQELDSYLETGKTGADRAEDKFNLRYKFTAVTPNEKMADVYNSGVTIEYDGDDVRNTGAEPVTYDPYFQDLGTRTETKENGKMQANYMDQAEVRMDAVISLKKLGIKSIKIKSNDKSLIKKYSSLGEVILVNDEDE